MPPRRLLLVAVPVTAAAAATALLLGDRPQDAADSAPAPGATAAPESAPPDGSGTAPTSAVPAAAAPTTAAPTTGAVVDPRAAGRTPVPTAPPAVVATDEPLPAAGGRVDVTVSYAEWDAAAAAVRVGAFVAGVVEEGGTCSLRLTLGADTRTATTAAIADASTTVCPPLLVPADQVGAGTWRAVVAYASPATGGTSAPVEVTVP